MSWRCSCGYSAGDYDVVCSKCGAERPLSGPSFLTSAEASSQAQMWGVTIKADKKESAGYEAYSFYCPAWCACCGSRTANETVVLCAMNLGSIPCCHNCKLHYAEAGRREAAEMEPVLIVTLIAAIVGGVLWYIMNLHPDNRWFGVLFILGIVLALGLIYAGITWGEKKSETPVQPQRRTPRVLTAACTAERFVYLSILSASSPFAKEEMHFKFSNREYALAFAQANAQRLLKGPELASKF